MLLNRLFAIYCFTDGCLRLKEFSCSGESYKNMGDMVVNVYNSKIASRKTCTEQFSFFILQGPFYLLLYSLKGDVFIMKHSNS